jgi:hypothetical protein
MNEYIYKSFSEKFESQKLRHELLSDIRYPNNINYAIMDPININGHLELKYVKNKYDNEGDRNPYLQNMNPNIRIPYCKPYWSDKEPNPFGYPLSLTQLGYSSQKTL